MSNYLRSRSSFLALFMVIFASLALSFAAIGCVDDDGGEAYCCLNDKFYDCPSGNAADACLDNFEPGSCSADRSQDSRCE